jgi:hypothetical protein
MSEEPTARDSTALGSLQLTLEAALHLLRELADDDLLRRMIAAFHACQRATGRSWSTCWSAR